MPPVIPQGFGAGAFYVPAPQPNDSGGTNMGENRSVTVIDGTPARVAVLGVAAAAVLVALRWSGMRFNVAVSS